MPGPSAFVTGGDLSDVPALVSGLQGADVCFHVAAKVEDFGPWPAYLEVNVEGTSNVLRACGRRESGGPTREQGMRELRDAV